MEDLRRRDTPAGSRRQILQDSCVAAGLDSGKVAALIHALISEGGTYPATDADEADRLPHETTMEAGLALAREDSSESHTPEVAWTLLEDTSDATPGNPRLYGLPPRRGELLSRRRAGP